MGALAGGGAKSPGLPLWLLRAAAALLLGLKLLLVGTAAPFMDETYYFLWGQHPALSYFDHPPLNAWLLSVSGALFGWTSLALRAPVLLTLALDLGVLWLFARREAPGERERRFWTLAVLFLATPIFFGVTAVSLPDHVLVLFGLLALYFLSGFLASWEAGAPRWCTLYIGALCVGLATLGKYNGVFLGLGFAALLVVSPRYRPLLRAPQLYLAGVLALLTQATVLWWNFSVRFASFEFILADRHRGLGRGFDGILGFALGMTAFLLPFLLVSVVMFAFDRRRERSGGERLGQAIFWVSTLGFAALSLRTTVLFHWNLAAYLALLPVIVPYLRSRLLLGLQVVVGALFLSGMIVNYSVLPITVILGRNDEASSWAYGWSETAARVATLKQQHGAGFVAASGYATASLLGFALGDKDVASISRATDAFDFWWNPQLYRGQDAIILVDNFRPLSRTVERSFARIKLLERHTVEQWGHRLDTYRIYLGTGFKPPKASARNPAMP